VLLIIIFIFVTNSFIKAKIISIFNTDLFSFRFYFDRKCFFIIFALIIINKIEYRVSLQFIFFIILGAIAIARGIITVTNKNPLVSAFGLIVQFFMLAGLYLTFNAQFVAVIQILVLAGAIMVLVVFVIMLLNLGNEQALKEKFNTRKLIAALFSLALVLQLTIIFSSRISNEKIS
jgi:NADH:ubiquinone oxidoreductase subunit 6 (subunit J)